MIVAAAENGVIGRNNELPWRLSGDLKHFAEITKGKTVLMGVNTYNSIISQLGHPLPGRENIVLTKEVNPEIKDVQLTSIEEVLEFAKDKEIFIIGGASVYRQMLPHTGKLYLTRVHASIEGDTSFPEISENEWRLVSSEKHTKDEKNEFDYTFLIYERKK